MDKWVKHGRLDKLRAIVTSLHAGGRGGVVASRDYRAQILVAQHSCVWAVLFREALLTLELEKGLEKDGSNKAHCTST